ncbi:hypothetical protein Daesc_001914 [Daldinia eschscholtzii]|uniref:Uncharacterized protein n=1 Tax=Daldinia eschscholtzii TaxID=292717 RepID=A0AAX6MVJ5_9PEZI
MYKNRYHSPFPLFVLSEKASTEYLNDILQRTADVFGDCYFLTLVNIPDPSKPYDCAPDKEMAWEGDREYEVSQPGTEPPISEPFVSPFIGKTGEDCARYLIETPEDKVWNIENFCMITDDDVSEDTITLVHRFENGAVHSFPSTVEETWGNMMTIWTELFFEEKLQQYQFIMELEPEKDRSVGKPFEFEKWDEE